MLIKNFQFLSSLRCFKRDLVSVHGHWRLIFLLILCRVPFPLWLRQWTVFISFFFLSTWVDNFVELDREITIRIQLKCFRSCVWQKLQDSERPLGVWKASRLSSDFVDSVYNFLFILNDFNFLQFSSCSSVIFCRLNLFFCTCRWSESNLFFNSLFSPLILPLSWNRNELTADSWSK